MADFDIRLNLMLGIQTALLGAVTRNLRAVTCGFDEKMITMRFIFDGEPTEWQRELCEVASTEVLAGFRVHHITVEILSHPCPNDIRPFYLKELVYLRWEPSEDEPG
ncbi:hypothetical protein FRD01_03995 [Microvenator marinus]|uniref:Uncharacterized protein n=1 Tax=Microvenator marinus TaxID=2600177 RepID=A0A5B8XKT1_9DELT|nr:hypothetical protein [Microvenator marinus]QED26422.1 hypothetical protein FRD01_03995 [Microvenator marinus]